MRELAAIQNDIDMMDRAIQNAGMGVDTSTWLSEKAKYEKEYTEAATYWEGQQNLQERVEQAKETGYLLDMLYTSSGLSMAELSHTPENHELVSIEVQKAFLAQQDSFNMRLDVVEYELTQEKIKSNNLIEIIDEMESGKRQSDLEMAELQNKLRNATDIIAENELEIKQQAKRISELLEQQASAAVPVAPLSAEEKETKLVADLMGNRLKVTNIRFKDESGLDRRKVLANNALTGDEIEEYAIYSKTRWEEISSEAAAQLQVDYASKKAEIEAQNTVIPTIEPDVEPVLEVEAPATEPPFPTDQMDAAELGLVTESPSGEGQMVENESEVITLESLDARITELERALYGKPQQAA